MESEIPNHGSFDLEPLNEGDKRTTKGLREFGCCTIKHHYLEASSQKSLEKEKENDRNKQKSLDSPMGLFFFLVFSRAVVYGSGEGTLAGIQSWYVIKIQRSSLFAFTVPVNSPACFLPSFPFEDQ